MVITRTTGLLAGIAAITFVVAVQAFNSFTCYKTSLAGFLESFWFIGIPLLPALIGLATKNPLRAVGASACFVPWLIFAYYADCIRPYSGGGASLMYVGVLFWGFPSAVVGAIISGPIFRGLGVTMDAS